MEEKKNEVIVVKDKPTKEIKKMSLAEYIEKNTVKPFNVKKAKSFIVLLAAFIGTILAACLFFMTLELFDRNEIAGYVGIGVSVIVFVIFFIVPLCSIGKLEAFQVRNVKYNNYRKAKWHNIELRNKLAQQIIDIVAQTEDTSWYDETKVGHLAIAKQAKDYKKLREVLSDIYKTDVKKACNKIITDHSVQVGIATALSPNQSLDTAFTVFFELEMIKEIVFLYGYRPSDYELAKIYKTIIVNSLLAYGTQTGVEKVASKVASSLGKSIPVFGGIIEMVAAATAEGLINSIFTVIVGFQTKKYLVDEYKLADTLEDLELTQDDLECEQAILKEVKLEVEETIKKQKEKQAKKEAK